MIPVNEKPLVISKINEKDTFVFRKDSAGLGVPRSTFGKLDHISAGVAQHGSVEKTVFVSSPNGRAEGNEAGNAANHGATATHTMPTAATRPCLRILRHRAAAQRAPDKASPEDHSAAQARPWVDLWELRAPAATALVPATTRENFYKAKPAQPHSSIRLLVAAGFTCQCRNSKNEK
jgi:hypothetical protein